MAGGMKRKNYTKPQILKYWEASDGRCWRCGAKIEGKPVPVYGTDWVLGHVGAAHWAGGTKVAPEHTACNSSDGKDQTKAAAKSVRIRAKAIGVKSKARSFNRSAEKKSKTKGLQSIAYGDDRVCRLKPN
jgi:hypothetical protein